MAVNLDKVSGLVDDIANELKVQFANLAVLPQVKLSRVCDQITTIKRKITANQMEMIANMTANNVYMMADNADITAGLANLIAKIQTKNNK